ncbi:Hypothetical protein I595_1059 [Croceitalea dokdonensis DOKDO 023]|uniref:Tetratricopeptide repeat protein n=1 Tax=Croceitalea dokdonensis DOKDO 023 TaxID=1300341 RepID=A0A0P7B0Z9_9FLAO|nr:hypothetical protein [Croceitalea dokdonensis]KPM32633.1 Hypothetical protein I595_1059 [Croceitalea dokdonensis DOKDO 023]
MNVSDFTVLLQNPDRPISPKQVKELEEMLAQYPYFQAARSVHLKALKNLESYRYNDALKRTAAHTADREVLFDFITSATFDQNAIADSLLGRKAVLKEKETIAEEVSPNTETELIFGNAAEDSPLPQTLEDAEEILNPGLFTTKEKPSQAEEDREPGEKLELGKPLPFTKEEKHSFNEWLQLTSKKPIRRKTTITPNPTKEKKKKFELLDKFIEKKPKIVPNPQSAQNVNIKESIKINQNQLMTETLAKVYLEQKKYKKAIQAFKILRLKYPEKSGFFADRILEVKKLQKENDKKQ